MPPVPERRKSKCENGTAFSPSDCNRKLIGARSFSRGLLTSGKQISKEDDFESARDYHSHETHKASIAAGSYVLGASHFGYARGTARGVAPSAHVAMYKVLWSTSTVEIAASDVLTGMDQTIDDGLDIMSLSLALPKTPYFEDAMVIASLSAIEKGIVIVCAAGNEWGSEHNIQRSTMDHHSKEHEVRDNDFEDKTSTSSSLFFLGVLKPDILALGQDVLAAVVPNKAYFKVGNYNMGTDYGFISGTSMATPHVAGVTALLKVVHHDWSPAAIRSAIMTTANTLDNTDTALKDQLTGLPATPLDFRAGHVNPNKAMDPGLIYNMGFHDYVDFLCRLGYNKKQMSVVLKRNQWSCNQNPTDLNYPSFIAIFPRNTSSVTAETFSRVVTNVGDDTAIYRAVVVVPS
ncbi:hypothetical protein ACSBR2_000552 [Camellia fascicularis]